MKLLLNNSPISLIAIVPNVDIHTPDNLFYPIAASSDLNYNDDGIMELYESGDIGKLRQIDDFLTLNRVVQIKEENPEFDYKFTNRQQEILSKGYADYEELIDRNLEVPQLLQYIRKCNTCTIPFIRKDPAEAYKNFAEYHNLDLSPKDYLKIIRQFPESSFQGCIRSKYRTFLGNKIFQFIHEDDYYNNRGEFLGHFKLWMEINLRLTYDGDVVALISLHDAEFKELPS